MKKTKLSFWLLILGGMALIVFQNEAYFLETQQVLRLNLRVFPEYQSPNLPLVFYHLLFFVFGLVIAYLFSALVRWRQRKAISRLTAEAAAQRKEMETLRAELAQLKGEPPADTVETSVTSPVAPR
jgi:surface polysaccharide O-acyltransferase-like enzyme